MTKLTIQDIREYQKRKKELKSIGEFKELGSELRDKFSLTGREAIDILHGNSDDILAILERLDQAEKKQGSG